MLPNWLADGRLVDTGVFDDIVQHGGHQALMVHVHVGQDAGHGQWVGDVGLATAAELAVVGLLGEVVGALDLVGLIRAQVGLRRVVEGIDRFHGGTISRFGGPDVLATFRGRSLASMTSSQLLSFLGLVFAGEDIGGDQAIGDFPQGDHRGLVGFFLDQRVLAAGGHLAGALAGDHDQLEAVRDVFQTIFYGYSCHSIPVPVSLLARRIHSGTRPGVNRAITHSGSLTRSSALAARPSSKRVCEEPERARLYANSPVKGRRGAG